MNDPGPTLLLIEDEDALRDLVASFLRRSGFHVDSAPDGPSGLVAYESARPALVLSDLRLPGLPGSEVCRRIRILDPSQPILVLSAAVEPDDRPILESLHIPILPKPFAPDVLLNRIHGLIPAGHPG